jgi:hypothetical protein
LIWGGVHRDLPTTVVVERFGDKLACDRVGRRPLRRCLARLSHAFVFTTTTGNLRFSAASCGHRPERHEAGQPVTLWKFETAKWLYLQVIENECVCEITGQR